MVLYFRLTLKFMNLMVDFDKVHIRGTTQRAR